jgi:ribosomal protein L11 methyltransferase
VPDPIDRPYRELCVYHLEGRVAPEEDLGVESFLGLWQEGESAFLFFRAPEAAAVARLLARRPRARLVDSYRMPYEQWQGAAVCGRIGRFAIRPPWERGAPADGAGEALPLIVDPGVVFGTGTHPTTRDCLAALEEVAAGRPARRVLDLGTGTGILALAAARLGCRRVLAVDANLLAARTARRNVLLNGFSERILVIQGLAEEAAAAPAELLVANLHGAAMRALLGAPGFRDKQRFILSGLMRREAKEVREMLARAGIAIVSERIAEGAWHTLTAVNRDGPGPWPDPQEASWTN